MVRWDAGSGRRRHPRVPGRVFIGISHLLTIGEDSGLQSVPLSVGGLQRGGGGVGRCVEAAVEEDAEPEVMVVVQPGSSSSPVWTRMAYLLRVFVVYFTVIVSTLLLVQGTALRSQRRCPPEAAGRSTWRRCQVSAGGRHGAAGRRCRKGGGVTPGMEEVDQRLERDKADFNSKRKELKRLEEAQKGSWFGIDFGRVDKAWEDFRAQREERPWSRVSRADSSAEARHVRSAAETGRLGRVGRGQNRAGPAVAGRHGGHEGESLNFHRPPPILAREGPPAPRLPKSGGSDPKDHAAAAQGQEGRRSRRRTCPSSPGRWRTPGRGARGAAARRPAPAEEDTPPSHAGRHAWAAPDGTTQASAGSDSGVTQGSAQEEDRGPGGGPQMAVPASEEQGVQLVSPFIPREIFPDFSGTVVGHPEGGQVVLRLTPFGEKLMASPVDVLEFMAQGPMQMTPPNQGCPAQLQAEISASSLPKRRIVVSGVTSSGCLRFGPCAKATTLSSALLLKTAASTPFPVSSRWTETCGSRRAQGSGTRWETSSKAPPTCSRPRSRGRAERIC